MSDLRLYHVSALASGFVRMWRAWPVVLVIVIVNAVLQALLLWPPYTYSNAWWTYLSALLSGVIFIASFGLMASAALRVAEGHVPLRLAVKTLRDRLGLYLLWAVVWLLVIAIGLALYSVVALVVAALTPFLVLAAIDGHRNALMRNLRTIGRRFWRWLVTVLIVGAVLLIADLGSGVFIFFIRNPFAALVVWLVGGLVIAWFTTAWALIYRSAWAND